MPIGVGLYVLAGPSGSGKSTVLGPFAALHGRPHFDPDEKARIYQARFPDISPIHASSFAWADMVRFLGRAIDEGTFFSFETSLAEPTITADLERAMATGIDVRMSFIALSSPELNVQRVRRRHERGGHSVPEHQIRAEYENSRTNLIRLLPHLTELRVWDNSVDADPQMGIPPEPRIILRTDRGVAVECDLESVPPWAHPIVKAALPDEG